MRPDPRLTPAADATATTGAGSHARRDNQACHHNPNLNHNPNPNPAAAQAHRESREQQGTTLAQTTGQQSSYAA